MQKDTTKHKRASKSHATTKKRAIRRVPAALRARALAIINGDAYDEDTRASIKFQLRTNYDGLADMVTRAEEGETICDTIRVSAERRNAARKVIALFETAGVPDFLTDAMTDALAKASVIKEINLWKPKGDAEVYDVAALSSLFAGTSPMFSLDRSDKQRVIDATAEILRNPQTPGDLFEHVAEFVTESHNKGGDSLHYGLPMLALVIGSHPEDELRGAIIAAREEGQS
jgi:hypothetical protein